MEASVLWKSVAKKEHYNIDTSFFVVYGIKLEYLFKGAMKLYYLLYLFVIIIFYFFQYGCI